jgi:hypothetical protein
MTIQLKRPAHEDLVNHASDIARIRTALEESGYTATDDDIAWAWREYSDDHWAAGWIMFKKTPNATIVADILKYLRPEDCAAG